MTRPMVNPFVTDLANGQPRAFADLYDRIGPSLFRVARTMCNQSTDAEDAVQDLFVQLVRYRKRLANVSDLDAYIYTMLRHAVHRQLQQKAVERKHLQRLPIVTTSELRPVDGLTDMLRALPVEQREVITLKIDAGLAFSQIAKVLGVSQNTAASRYRYALEKLRTTLETDR